MDDFAYIYEQQRRQPPLPVRELERFLTQGMNLAAVAHSYHVQAMRDPSLRGDDAFQRFNEVELHELHHQVAAWGDFLRMQRGESDALNGLSYNLSRFLENRQIALQTARDFSPAARRNPYVLRMLALVRESNRMIEAMRPVLNQVIRAGAAAGAPGRARPGIPGHGPGMPGHGPGMPGHGPGMPGRANGPQANGPDVTNRP